MRRLRSLAGPATAFLLSIKFHRWRGTRLPQQLTVSHPIIRPSVSFLRATAQQPIHDEDGTDADDSASSPGWHGAHPLREAAKKVDASVPVLTGDPMIRASDVAGASGFDVESLHHELLSLSNDDLIRRASRELSSTPSSCWSIFSQTRARRPLSDGYRPGQ
jgi:hypothetical protein